MTGRRADADDLTQEAMARALERAEQATGPDPTGWVFAIAARLCLDHLRREKTRRRLTELVDPLEDVAPLVTPALDAAILREDVRLAVVVALQRLSPRQRAALVLY